MQFAPKDISVFYRVAEDPSVTVNENRFMTLATEVSEEVYQEFGLDEVARDIEAFEAEYVEMKSGGLYQLNRDYDTDELGVAAHQMAKYPLDPAMVNSEEPGNISQATFDSYEALLVEAQEEVARRLSDRLDEFVTLQ
jgi:hypothetical protein